MGKSESSPPPSVPLSSRPDGVCALAFCEVKASIDVLPHGAALLEEVLVLAPMEWAWFLEVIGSWVFSLFRGLASSVGGHHHILSTVFIAPFLHLLSLWEDWQCHHHRCFHARGSRHRYFLGHQS